MKRTLIAAFGTLCLLVAVSGNAAASSEIDVVELPQSPLVERSVLIDSDNRVTSIVHVDGGGGGENTCNGLFDNNCICEDSNVYCDEGERCTRYALNHCIEG